MYACPCLLSVRLPTRTSGPEEVALEALLTRAKRTSIGRIVMVKIRRYWFKELIRALPSNPSANRAAQLFDKDPF